MSTASSSRGRDAPAPEVPEALSGTYQLLFQRIYEEVVASARDVAEAMAQGGVGAPTCEEVQQRIIDLVERLADGAQYLPASNEKRLALYVIVAMADEVILRAVRLGAWPGRQEWAKMPLEQHIFRSHSAGERVFDLLDDALANRIPLSRDLLEVFLTALALGFCGRFPDGTEPEAYRVRLAEHLGHGAPGDDGTRADAMLFQHTARAGAERVTLPSPMNGVYPILAVLALWFVAGIAIWGYSTFGLNQLLEGVEGAR